MKRHTLKTCALFGVVASFLLSWVGCSTGITTGNPSGRLHRLDTPIVGVASADSGIVKTPNLIVFVRTPSVSLPGDVSGGNVLLTDPFVDLGLERVLGEAQ